MHIMLTLVNEVEMCVQSIRSMADSLNTRFPSDRFTLADKFDSPNVYPGKSVIQYIVWYDQI